MKRLATSSSRFRDDSRSLRVFLLVNLKEKLYHLDLAHNPKINDDAIPAILFLTNLAYLSIQATGVDMPGLRRLATAIYTEDRAVDIEIPFRCEKYLDSWVALLELVSLTAGLQTYTSNTSPIPWRLLSLTPLHVRCYRMPRLLAILMRMRPSTP
jgi:hypothetical protein